MGTENTSFFYPWHSFNIHYSSQKKENGFIKTGISDRVHACVIGTFYDFFMIPCELAKMIIKAPVVPIRAILIPILGKDHTFMPDWTLKKVVYHAYRVVAFAVAFVSNPFISLFRPDVALNFHKWLGLVEARDKTKRELSESEFELIGRDLHDLHLLINLLEDLEGDVLKISQAESLGKAYHSLQKVLYLKQQFEQLEEQRKIVFEPEKNLHYSSLVDQAVEKATYYWTVLENELQAKNESFLKEAEDIGKNILERSSDPVSACLILHRLIQLKNEFKFHSENKFLNEHERLKLEKGFTASLEHAQTILRHMDEALHAEIAFAYSNNLLDTLSGTVLDLTDLANDQDVKSRFFTLYKLRAEDRETKNRPDRLLARKMASALFAESLMIKSIPTKEGKHGARYIQSAKGNLLGVYKVPQQLAQPETKGWGEYIWNGLYKMTEIFGNGQHLLLNDGVYNEVCGEKAAYLIGQELKNPFLTLAPTEILMLNNYRGAFLVFCKNAKKAADVKNVFQKKKESDYSDYEKNIFQSFIIFDFLIGNLDRHLDNWLVNLDADGKLEKIVPIDNSNILPKEDPALMNLDVKKNRYAWSSLALSSLGFTSEIIEWIDGLDDDFVEKIISKINHDHEISSLYRSSPFVSQESKDLMIKRFNLIKRIVLGQVKTPFELANCQDCDSLFQMQHSVATL